VAPHAGFGTVEVDHSDTEEPMQPLRHARRTPGMPAVLVALPLAIAGLLAGCGSSPAASPTASSGTVTVSDAWARPAAAGTQTAAYFTITNRGTADTLLSARCALAGSTMIHRTTTDASGMTGMSMMMNLPVPAGATVRLEPGGMHVMMTGLTKPFEAGGTVELQLTFEHAGVIVVVAAVRPG